VRNDQARAILRQTIPVDDQWHILSLRGPIVHVATRGEDYVEVWFIEDSETKAEDRAFRVIGTGQLLAPALARHVGTAITPSGRFVWHLMEHERADLAAGVTRPKQQGGASWSK
jgi:hypothetical protein